MTYQYHKDGTLPPATSNVFVFGSNLAGIHGAGAARVARNLFGYPMKLGSGFHSSSNIQESYGIPTKDHSINTLPITEVEKYVSEFKQFVLDNPGKNFFITRIGCGLAGFKDSEIAPLFKDFPENCSFALEWKVFIEQLEMNL